MVLVDLLAMYAFSISGARISVWFLPALEGQTGPALRVATKDIGDATGPIVPATAAPAPAHINAIVTSERCALLLIFIDIPSLYNLGRYPSTYEQR